MMENPVAYPYFFPYQTNLTEEQALDWHLERFFNLCIFVKLPSTSATNSNNLQQQQINFKLIAGKSFNQLEIGKEFFGEFVKTFTPYGLVNWFLRLFFRLPTYLQLNDAANRSRHFTRHGLSFQQFFFQVFLIFFKISRDDERLGLKYAKVNGVKRPQPLRVCDDPTDSQYVFQQSERQILLRLLIRLDFPVQSKIWSLLSASTLSVLHKDLSFPLLVKEAVQAGDVAFWALQYALTRFGSEFEDVSVLAHLLILDKVNGRMIEEFLQERSEEDREKARQILLHAESHWATNFDAFQQAVITITRRSNVTISIFENFKENMTDLMIEMRRELPRCNLVSFPWAKAAIRIYMEKYYAKKETSIEQLYDLVYTILKQRTSLRNDIVQAFRRYNDFISAEYWNNFYVDHKINQFQLAIMQPKKNAPPRMVYRSNDSFDMHEERENYLSLPAGIDVLIVDKVPKFAVINHYIKQCMESEYAVVGLDSEWSPYVLCSRASILQIAFHSVVFILDLDALCDRDELTQFIDSLFHNPKIIKIGFQFGEDLLQLKKALPKCWSLYEPVCLIEMNRVVSQLMILSQKANFPVDEYIKFPAEEVVNNECELPKAETEDGLDESKTEETLNESTDEIVNAVNITTESTDENDLNNMDAAVDAETLANNAMNEQTAKDEKKLKNMGFSTLCQYMLGKPLDKSEQCSVWTRRPMRKSQMRYGALDAYSILMLYDRCAEWAAKLGLKITDITDAQPQISAPLPLFFDRSKLTSTSKLESSAQNR